MRLIQSLTVLTLLCASAAVAQFTEAQKTGDEVIAAWTFDGDNPARDVSGHGHDLTLRGETSFTEDGKFGGALRCTPTPEGTDDAQGAVAKSHEQLTPPGAFTIEMWFKLDPGFEAHTQLFLVDKKNFHYAKPDLLEANHDYNIYMGKSGNQYHFTAGLGFGEAGSTFATSEPVELEADRWFQFAFIYDGVGTMRFYLDGQLVGRESHPQRGAISGGGYALHLGARVGSSNIGFPGRLDEVRISNGIPEQYVGNIELSTGSGRSVFQRMEPDAVATVAISNDTGMTLSNVTATLNLGGVETKVTAPDLEPAASHAIQLPIDASLRPDSYDLLVTVTADAEGKAKRAERTIPIVIVPRHPRDRFPVIAWGGSDMEKMKWMGFTGHLDYLQDYNRILKAGEPTQAMDDATVAKTITRLDQLLANGLTSLPYTYPGSWFMSYGPEELKAKVARLDAGGEPMEDRTDASMPFMQEFGYNVGASIAQTFGDHPALTGMLIHSEVRDNTAISYRPYNLTAFRDFAGYDKPEQAKGANGVHYTTLDGFPSDRVVPDDDPILTFYRWFWKDGDGWNPMHTAVHRGIHENVPDGFFTFFDPVVRVPSIWGSGGNVDVISQWTYSYPDPIKIGQTTDEMFAMAAGDPDQQVMKMTQIIWYRSGTAPNLPEDEADYADWEREKPDARFITIAPDHLREALWSKISRPIRGIMYHGWTSLVQVEGNTHAYQFTNEETSHVLAGLTDTVIEPLGPTLLNVPDRPADVAVLESFSSQMFAGRGTHGWGGTWEADLHLALQWAHYQPAVVFEENIQRDGLDQYKVLVMPYCDVLPQSVVDAIHAWQRQGGIVIGDEFLCPAITPDILVPAVKRDKDPSVAKAALQKVAAELREQLAPFYDSYGDSDNADVIIRFRRFGTTDYLFALSDKRTFGDYVGHHRLVMEKGLPTEGAIMVHRDGGHVYELVSHQPVAARRSGDGLRIDASFGPTEGKLYMITHRPIEGVAVAAPSQTVRGASAKVVIEVRDDRGEAIDAVVPVQLRVTDPSGREAEFSGYYAAVGGQTAVTLNIAANDEAGVWTIEATELASGKKARARMNVGD
jgi:hypothetical protein